MFDVGVVLAVPKNAARAFSKESSVIRFDAVIFDLPISELTTTSDNTREIVQFRYRSVSASRQKLCCRYERTYGTTTRKETQMVVGVD